MKPKFLSSLFLMAAATDLPSGGGGGETQQPPAPDGGEQQGEPQGGEPKKPGVIAQAAALIRDKASLLRENAELKQKLQAATEENERLSGEIGGLKQQVAGFEEDMATLDQALKAEEAKTRDVGQAAAQVIAGKGFDPTALPASQQDGQETIESLNEQLAKEKNPRERNRIQQRINKLEEAAAAA